jgi:hypothetical protein
MVLSVYLHREFIIHLLVVLYELLVNQQKPRKVEFQNLNFLVFQPNLMQFFVK